MPWKIGEREKTYLFLLIALGFLLNSYHYTQWAAGEDTYITLRYARNLAAGNGLTFNPGERVEGITNFLWAVILAGLYAAGLHDLPRVSVGLEILVALGILWLVWRWTRRLLPVLLLAIFPGFTDCIGIGLETTLAALLVLLSAWLLWEKKIYTIGSLLLGLLFMTRPDGGIVAVLMIPLAWLMIPREERRAGDFLRLTAPWPICVLVMELFRYGYFGEWVPNTFFIKTGIDPLQDLIMGAKVFSEYLLSGGWAFLLLTAAAFASKDNPKARVAGLIASALLGYSIWTGGPSMHPARFLTPVIPLLLATGTASLVSFRAPQSGKIRPGPAILTALFAVAAVNTAAARHLIKGSFFFDVKLVSMAVGRLNPGESAAMMAIGQIGWENPEVRIVDPLGLTSAEVAKHGERQPKIHYPGHRVYMTFGQLIASGADYHFPLTKGAVQGGCLTRKFTLDDIKPWGVDARLIRDPRYFEFFSPVTVPLDEKGDICALAFKRIR